MKRIIKFCKACCEETVCCRVKRPQFARRTGLKCTLFTVHFTLYILHCILDRHAATFSPVYIQCACISYTPAAPKRPAHSTVPSQVATHIMLGRVCPVLGRSWTTNLQSGTTTLCRRSALPVSLAGTHRRFNLELGCLSNLKPYLNDFRARIRGQCTVYFFR